MKLESECTRKMLLFLILTVGVFVEKVSLQNINPVHVPFGHIFRDGIDDLTSDDKRPIDILEFSFRYPKTQEEVKRLLQTSPRKLMRIEPDKRVNPRNKYTGYTLRKKGNGEKSVNTTDDEHPHWFDLEKIHRENTKGILPQPQMKSKSRSNYPTHRTISDPIGHNFSNKSEFDKFYHFSRHNFGIPSLHHNTDGLKWTTCEEFEKDIGPNNVVYPKDIVNIEWEPFYIWDARNHLIAVVHKFTYPTKKIVQEFKDKYEKFVPTLDWEQPKLFLTERSEMLLIAGDRKGLFHGLYRSGIPLPTHDKNFSLPTPDIRLKIIDPYLALMHCNDLYATIMASGENVPKTDEEKREEAALLKFKGRGYAASRDYEWEKLNIEKDKKRREKGRKVTEALPGYPGIDDIDDIF